MLVGLHKIIIVFEVFSACMTSTWLPSAVMRGLGVRHVRLGKGSLARCTMAASKTLCR